MAGPNREEQSMHRQFIFVVIGTTIIAGCAARTPVVPDTGRPSLATQQPSPSDNPHRLYGEWKFYFDAAHDQVDVVPEREGRFHLNTLKFLESYCADCLKITEIQNNGDGTIDLTVQITHPFPGLPQYTGFDVKGIIMFQGSHQIPDNLWKLPLYPESLRLSWRLMGDPELLNADGYTYLWSPWYDSGSTLPRFSYWPGKYASGTPTANVNGYLDFYSSENRHMFETGKTVSRVYHISLPPGPVTAGYAVDACWELPTVTPVTDPANDFPFSANQPEAYRFKVVLNDGKPVTSGCCNSPYSVHTSRCETDVWYKVNEAYPHFMVGVWNEEYQDCSKTSNATFPCDQPPEHPNWYCLGYCELWPYIQGTHQLLGYEYHDATPLEPGGYYKALYPAFDVFEVVIE
jgi:hypothetical protein